MDERLQQLNPEARKAVVDKMTLKQKAEHGYLPDYLSIKEICDLMHPISWPPSKDLSRNERAEWNLKRAIERAAHEQFKNELIGACEAGLLKYEGNIKGWEYYQNQPNPHPLARLGRYGGEPPKESTYLLGSRGWRSEFDRQPLTNRFGKKYYCYTCGPTDCALHKAEFKCYLQSRGQWPVTGLLANWWADEEEPQQADTPKPELTQSTRNEQDNSERSRILAYYKEIWAKDGRQLTGEPFLRELKNHENPKKCPDKGPIFNVVVGNTAGGRGFWFDFGEGGGEKFYTYTTLAKRVSEWRTQKKDAVK